MTLTKNEIIQDISKLSGINIKAILEEKEHFKLSLHIFGTGNVSKATVLLNYTVTVKIPYSYPNSLPISYEYGDKKVESYHHINPDRVNSFCLGTEMEIRQRLYPTYNFYMYLVLLMEYLTIYSYYSKYRTMPVTERSHGNQGVLEGYQALFNLNSKTSIKNLLRIVPVSNDMKNKKCPCGSERKFKYCHFNQMHRITKSSPLLRQATKDLKTLNIL